MKLGFFIYDAERKMFLDYLDLMDKALKKEGKEMEKWMRKQETKIHAGEDQALFDAAVEGMAEDLNMYSELLFESSIVSLYSYLENQLDELCSRAIKKDNLTLQLSDITGKGIERARIFMKKVCRWLLPEEILWEELIYLREIRNAIVHNRGIIKEEKMKKFVDKQNKKEISYWPNGKLILSKTYCEKAINLVFTYLKKLSALREPKKEENKNLPEEKFD